METTQYQKKSFFLTWLLICFATGPVSSMARTYIPAALQTMAHKLGETKSGKPCEIRGNDCFVSLGSLKIHSNSYVLYLKAFYTFVESVIAMFVMNIGDFSNYKKWILCCSIMIYGFLAIPFAGFRNAHSVSEFIGMSVLFCLINIANTIIQILEASYIPSLMRTTYQLPIESEDEQQLGESRRQSRRQSMLNKGSKVSSLGLVLGNLGAITALFVGLILTKTEKTSENDNKQTKFLISITIAGCSTALFAFFTMFMIPSVKQAKPNGFIIFVSFKRFWSLGTRIRKFPNAFIFCFGWVIWNLSFSNFMSVYLLLFRSTLGIGKSDSQFTLYAWLSYVLSTVGSLLWMCLYLKTTIRMKTWAFIFLAVSLFTQFWGCLGINDTIGIGFKHSWEFWLFEVLYSTTSSALRCLNRVVYSSLLPIGEEVQQFGLVIILGVMINWAVDLLIALIQDITGDDRYPFVLNLFLVLMSIFLYAFCNIEEGVESVEAQEEQMAQDSDATT